jgi:molybdopterin molybdotransferase
MFFTGGFLMKYMVPLEEAQQLLLQHVKPLEPVELDLLQALGMVLAEDVPAPEPVPPFTRSRLDGFALKSGDTDGSSSERPVSLLITRSLKAGQLASTGVEPGTAMAIVTGAPVPPGADCVVPFEDVRREGGCVVLSSPLRPGQGIVPAGGDVAAGDRVMPKGTVVGAPATGVLAALGLSRIKVHRKPRVAVFATGDELQSPGKPLGNGKIYNSNLYTMAALVSEAGGEAVLLETVPDEEDLICRQYNYGLSVADLVLSTGGAAAGERDLASAAMRRCGARLLFRHMELTPGKYIVCGEKNGRLLLGLSGKPASAVAAFTLLARPVLRRMGGYREIFLPRVEATLVENIQGGLAGRSLVRAEVRWQDECLVRPAPRGAGSLLTLMTGNAFIDLPGGCAPLGPGAKVQVILLV